MRSSLLLGFLTLVACGLAIFFYVQLRHARAGLGLANEQVLARDRVIFRQQRAGQQLAADSAARAALDDSVRVEMPASAVFADQLGSLTGAQLSDLMKAGLTADPEAALRNDLLRHQSELLPGTHLRDVRILTPHYALAADATGYALLRYDLSGPESRISWKVLDHGD